MRAFCPEECGTGVGRLPRSRLGDDASPQGLGFRRRSWAARRSGRRSDGVLLVPEVGRHRAGAAAGVPARAPRAPRTSPTEGPAILASNHLSYADWLFMPLTLPRRVTFVAKAEYFNTPGIKGWFQKKFFSGAGPGADRPLRRRRRRGRAARGQAGARRGRAVRDLPRGHPLARRPALPRQDRRGPAGAGDRRAGHPGGRGRHRRRGASRQEVRLLHPPDGALRQAAGLLPLRGHGERPLHPALDHRRDHVRDHAALRPGVRRPVRRRAPRRSRRRPRRRAATAAPPEPGTGEQKKAS